MRWQDQYADKIKTPEEAARLVKSGDKVVVANLLQPITTCMALAKRKDELEDVLLLAHWNNDFPWFQKGWEKSFQIHSAFILRPTREGHKEKRFDFVASIFGISNGERHNEYLRSGIYPGADVYIVQVSPPDKNGWCSFGYHVWWSPTAVKTAKLVIAEVVPDFVRTYGGNLVHISDLDVLVENIVPVGVNEIIHDLPIPHVEDWEKTQVIGALIAEQVKDGDTVQIGTGTASEAAWDFFDSKNDLGIDSEIIHIQAIDLIKSGNITGKRKNINTGKTLATGLVIYPGNPKNAVALDYIDMNPAVELWDVSHICNVPRIAANDNMVTINTAAGIDLNGQVTISHLGPMPISGPGGQVEYTIGSHYSKGGRSFLALLSTAKNGAVSRIVPHFEPGTVTMLPNVYVDYLVTENGIVNLEGKSDRQRAEAIISVAHPDFQPELRKAAQKMFWP